MGRIGVSYEDVVQAAQETQGKGKNPTVDNIRLIIGSGSKSTIARHLKEWRNQQGIARSSDGAIPSELLGLVKGLWERLRDSVEQKAHEYQCEADEKVKHIQQQFTQSQQQYAILQEQQHQLEEKEQQQQKIIAELQGALVLEQQEKAKISERAISQALHQQEQQSEIERLHQLLKHVQNNLEHYQIAMQRLREEQLSDMDKQRNEYEQKICHLQQQITSITAERSSYKAQYTQVHETFEKLQLNHEILNQANQEAQTKNHSLSQENIRLTQQYQNQTSDLEVNKRLVIELQITSMAYKDRLTLLEMELAKAEDKIQTLRDNFSFVSQEKANLEGQVNQLQKYLDKDKVKDQE